MMTLFAAVHESAIGPSLHFSTFSIYVGFWGKPEVRRQTIMIWCWSPTSGCRA
jgi:hypothetical protein